MSLLDALYTEYRMLQEKLDKVSALIISYGGTLPEKRLPWSTIHGSVPPDYSVEGTWKEKIISAVRDLNIPSTAKEIAMHIVTLEQMLGNKPDAKHVTSMVTQYLSNMSIAGEVEVDKTGQRNKYFLEKTKKKPLREQEL
ncbi:hypothetical protein ACWKWU_08790 [Chitinophaga lutea]